MLYLLMIVIIAARLGRGPAVMSAFVAVGSFDFFHVAPHLSFAVSDMQYLLTFAVMLGVALFITHLTTSLKERASEARVMAARSQALANLARTLTGAPDSENVQRAIDAFAQVQFSARAALLCPDPHEVLREVPAPSWATTSTLLIAAKALFIDREVTSPVRVMADQGIVVLRQLQGATRSRGVLLLMHTGMADWHPPASLLDAVASLAATALERLHYVEVAHSSQLEMMSERLRSSILSALSHDIRTPLTALYGQADTVLSSQPQIQGAAAEMVTSIRDQAWRLHHMVSKLLDMAKLHSGQEGGGVSLRREWQPLEEVIGASIKTLGAALADHRIQVRLPDDLPLVWIDAVLMERVFGNLLENAAKYGPANGSIHVEAQVLNMVCEVRVCDAGPGFPAGSLEAAFRMFERGERESAIPGMGLGLAISKAIVLAHGGQIEALNPSEGGAEVRFTLPLGSPPEIEPELHHEMPA